MIADVDQRRYISSEELEKHNSPSDLWISIQGKVYNATEWVKDHPGGEIPLLNLAGQDATDAFVAFHPASAWKHLDQFFVGYYLSDYRVSDVSKDYRRLVAEFTKLGMYEDKGHGVLLSLSLISVFFAIAIYFIIGTSSVWLHLIAGGMMGLLWIQSGFIGHDSGHYNIMISPGFNRLAQILCGNCLTGISIGWWVRTHNAHHIAVNNLQFDPDLQHMPVFAVSSKFFQSLTSVFYDRTMPFDSISRLFVSYQHLSYYPVMIFARLNLYAQSVFLVLSNKKVPGRWQEIVGMIIFWIWYSYLISFLPNLGEKLLFVIASFAVTAVQHVQFTLNHFSASVYVGNPKGNDWFEKQTMGTIDISCSPWMDWFHGGLQFQVEHHLFPRLPRNHLRRISPLVKELCKKHKLQYSSFSFWEANLRTLRTLKVAALQARDLSCPAPKNLLWEALNIHG
ncbi:Delta(8)-fatty-acid desaturase [Platanthera guangdongensis]|uniref:Delta(8)-fatty-acid desaturase n=1 Tax=Platanthera guangdongensis TaxID=2320717 RepID=A0ABR2M1V3_9ASPA